jgi:hypothetical protein
MILIVETNFILELALQREQEAACKEILELCQPGHSGHLVIPAFASAEAAMALERPRAERRRLLHAEVKQHVEDLQRSKPRRRLATLLRELQKELTLVDVDEPESLLRLIFDPAMECVEVIPMTQAIRDALMFHDTNVVTHVPDALVLSSVAAYLATPRIPPTYFASRDQKLVNNIAGELRKRNCSPLRSFNAAAALFRRA